MLPSHYDTIYQVKNRSRNSFKDGWLIIGLNERYGIIDFDGKEILPLNYQNIELHNRWLKVRDSGGKSEFIAADFPKPGHIFIEIRV